MNLTLWDVQACETGLPYTMEKLDELSPMLASGWLYWASIIAMIIVASFGTIGNIVSIITIVIEHMNRPGMMYTKA